VRAYAMEQYIIEKTGEYGDLVLYGSGWKAVSMVDVYGSVTFTLWTCGCNLRCPFCHNWRLAVFDREYCKRMDTQLLLEELESSKFFIDYLHVTGGEPLVQYRSIERLFHIVKDFLGVKVSLNSNLTLYKPFKNIVKKGLVDHVATDLKIPFAILTGHSREAADILWSLYKKSLKLIVDYDLPLELRVPVSHLYRDGLKQALEILNILNKYNGYYVIIQPLLGEPITSPRDPKWCKEFCNPSKDELYEIAEWFKVNGASRVYVKETIEA
jgi:pyruvate formate lyase activating enzyme